MQSSSTLSQVKSVDLELATELPLPIVLAEDNSPVESLTRQLADATIGSEALQVLRDRVGKDAAAIAAVINTCLEDAPQLLPALRTPVDRGDASGLQCAAYILKSSSATLGAMKLYQLCQDLEDMSKGGTTIAPLALVSQLEAEYERVQARLQAQ
jgi:HPt (histidine-containing phosphotransfer) domain-containing protein